MACALVVDSFSSRRRITLASLGGLALGLTVLAGASFLLLLLPIIVIAGALLAGRRPQAIPLAAGWLAGLVCGLAADTRAGRSGAEHHDAIVQNYRPPCRGTRGSDREQA